VNRTRITAAVVLAAALAGSLAGCGGGPSAAACKAAMTRDYHYALTHPDAPPATKPAACKGLPDATIAKFAAEIMAGS
jgi:hypothetical protein